MKLFTKEIMDKFKKQGDTSEKHTNEITVICKLFGGGACSWYLYEYNEEYNEFMAYVNLGDSSMAELGAVSREEIENLKLPPLGLGVERDLYFKQMNLKVLIDKVKSGEHV